MNNSNIQRKFEELNKYIRFQFKKKKFFNKKI